MPVCLFLCFTGLALLWWTQKQKLGKVLVTLGLLLLTALSYEPVSNALLGPLERQYPPYVKREGPPAKYVVVLGGGHTSDPSLPITSQIGDESLKRLVEGIRIYRDNPGSKLVLSGGSWLDSDTDAGIMAKTARAIGMNDADIILESESRDTEDQARLLKPLLSTNQFILVTSASHMPRSMRLFNSQYLMGEAAPTEHMVRRGGDGPSTYFPRGRRLQQAERAFYEYMAAVWLRLRSQT